MYVYSQLFFVLIIPIITCDGYWSNVFSYHQQFFLRGWYGLVIQASLIGDFTMKHMGTTFKHDGWWLGAILPFENSSVGDIMGYVMDNSHNGVQEPCCLMFSIIVIEWGFNHERWWLNQIKLWYTGNLLWFFRHQTYGDISDDYGRLRVIPFTLHLLGIICFFTN